MTIYATKGELVTCENGHPIARVAVDLEKGMRMRVDQLEWLISAPEMYRPIDAHKCTCGAAYIRSQFGAGAQLFIDGKYRHVDD